MTDTTGPTLTWHVGDALTVLRTLETASVDLVLSSPPFLALRSYLPSDHPDKPLEGGSQATPGEYLDWLLDVVEECRRVLAPHGSLCFELGDTYAGSGGAGGDYDAGGLRDGQERFDGSASKAYGTGAAARPARVGRLGRDRNRKAGMPEGPHESGGGHGWPLDKSLTLVPETFRFALAYGVNPFTGRETPRWRIRNVVRWVRPNPPVGALADKFRPGTSEMVVACTRRDRYFDLDAVRQQPNGRTDEISGGYRRAAYPGGSGDAANPEKSGPSHPAGAPPLDWWQISTAPFRGSHYATFPPELCVRPILAMTPPLVCPGCGPIYPVQSSHDKPGVRGMCEADNEPASEAVLWPELWPSGDPERATGGGREERAATAEPATRIRGSAMAQPSHGEPVGGDIRAPSDHGRALGPAATPVRDRSSQERNPERQPARESRTDGQNGSRSNAQAEETRTALPSLRRSAGDDRACPRCGGLTRPGVVLDPFAGTFTTGLVAHGHGRSATGIDLDMRNLELARGRLGPLVTLTVVDHSQTGAAEASR